jgi:hypothetical protein
MDTAFDDGWHLYVGTAVPRPAVGDFDEAAERYPVSRP